MKKDKPAVSTSTKPRRKRWTSDDTELTLLGLPAAIWYAVFCYLPMFGLIIAFKNFKITPGKSFLYSLFHSDWAGFDNFKFFLTSNTFAMLLRNTLLYNILFIVLNIVIPVTLAVLMFREVQAEIARRNSKSAANQRKRHQGRYNSKYALSERLVCGDCGSPYKRVTWNIHGRKQIVWRCVNRLEYGTKFCSHSPSIPEEELHQAILKAVQNLAANFTDEVAAQLDGILRQMKAGENLKAQLQKQLEKAQQEFDRLLEMSLELDESTPFLDDKLRKLSGKIKILKANIAESTDGKGEDEEATKQLTAQDLLIKEYDDILTARIIEKVIVHSRQEIEIYFIGGYTQKIDLI